MNPTEYWNGVAGAYEIERSLRFNDDDTASLNRTFGTSTNNQKSTVSFWVKRSTLGAVQHIWQGGVDAGVAGNSAAIRFLSNDTIQIYDYQSGYAVNLYTNQVFRDVSAWYHIVFAIDTTQGTPANRNKFYVNGERVTSFSTQTNYGSGDNPMFNKSSTAHYIGKYQGSSSTYYFDGYLAEVNFIDGTALDHTSFGKTDTATGAWIPKKYSGSYGTNGFYLSFSDNSSVSALGTDSSGNGNNWTPTNFSVTAGSGNDSMEDTPTNNWCTWNPLRPTGRTYSNGNLYSTGGAFTYSHATLAVPTSSGKYYFEIVNSGTASNNFGFALTDGTTNDPSGSTNGFFLDLYDANASTARVNGVSTNLSSYHPGTATGSHTYAVAIDFDNRKIQFYKNNSGGGEYTFSAFPDGTYLYPGTRNGGAVSVAWTLNAGQNGFTYTPPAGFKALNTANLPVPTIKDGSDYFTPVLYTGDDSVGRAITVQDSVGNGWQPDFVWVKARNQAYSHHLYDSVRGASKRLLSNGTQAEFDQGSGDGVTAFNPDGFDVSHTSSDVVNQLNTTYVAWNWKAGGSSSSNTDGTITSTVSANVDAGFSIVSYTSNGTSGATLGHGLGASPGMIIVKMRTDQSVGTDNWAVFHKSLGATKNLWLDASNSQNTSATYWNDTEPTSSVFSLGNDLDVNHSNGYAYIAYCFAEVEGFSKFGSYTGNGSTDGPFVSCGFRPSLILLKSSTAAESWEIMDNKRDVYNGNTGELRPNLSNAETTPNQIDFLSNGFKIRTLAGQWNTNGQTYIFMALAENPFKYANAR